MRILFSVCIAIFFLQSNAIGQLTTQKDKNEKVVEINIAPLTIMSYRPRYRVGVELKYNLWNFSVNGEYGSYGLNNYMYRDTRWGEDYKYYSIRPQVMICYHSTNIIEQHVGLETFYIHNSDRLRNDYFNHIETPRKIYKYKEADYRRTMKGFHFVFQTKYQMNDFLGIDFYIGLGMAYRTNQYSNFNGMQTYGSNYPREGNLIKKNYREEGKGWLASGTIGFNLSYLLWKN